MQLRAPGNSIAQSLLRGLSIRLRVDAGLVTELVNCTELMCIVQVTSEQVEKWVLVT